jgi:hypothetical protein
VIADGMENRRMARFPLAGMIIPYVLRLVNSLSQWFR